MRVAYFEKGILLRMVSCLIFNKTAPKSGASTKCTLRSQLHSPDATPSVFKSSVCEDQFDLINIFFWYKQRMVLVYTEPSTIRIGEAGFEQLANVFSFRVPNAVLPRKM